MVPIYPTAQLRSLFQDMHVVSRRLPFLLRSAYADATPLRIYTIRSASYLQASPLCIVVRNLLARAKSGNAERRVLALR